MQYRVGAFGFFYQGSQDAPGNMGLYDQALALEWIKANIKSFRGDGNEITLFGESAGAGCVSTHLISPVSRHIPKRAVLQSGAINAPWSNISPQKSLEISEALIQDCGCQDGSYKERMQCMLDLPASNISKAQWNSYWGILGFPSSPTVDGEFLPRHPWEMLLDGDFSKIDIIIGTNQDEGTFFILYDFLNYFKKDNPSFLTRENFVKVVEEIFLKQWPVSTIEMEAIKYQYTDWEQVNDGFLNQKMIGDLVGDFFFVCPCNFFASQYAEHGNKVYYYYFNHRTSSNPWGDWMGVLHGDEIDYVFGVPLKLNKRYTEDETALSRKIIKHYEHFAKTGNPVFEKGDSWPLYNKNRPQYYIWNANIKGTGNGPHADACAFWNVFMPKLKTHNNTMTVKCGQPQHLVSKLSTGAHVRTNIFVLFMFCASHLQY
ncbi:acetylcholinesterase [Eurytemora carolleeae]|uniref:acetylcholinesterase n=1 Tax=Eurytemora carolleeae TaxID=1294199 RepID=UPI000C792554|nr:acetylcholinesterase [Eurytemora carolleeae]|eukprot:XP_023348060.1 acetylcholinesterase-like [Eurytemora affinis]